MHARGVQDLFNDDVEHPYASTMRMRISSGLVNSDLRAHVVLDGPSVVRATWRVRLLISLRIRLLLTTMSALSDVSSVSAGVDALEDVTVNSRLPSGSRPDARVLFEPG